MSETGQYLRTHLQSLKQEQTTTAKAAYEFKFTPVQLLNDELPLRSLLDDGSREPQVPQGACLLISANMIEQTRILMRSGKEGSGETLVTDWTYKIGAAGC